MSKPHRRNLGLLSALGIINLGRSSNANCEVPKPKTPNDQPTTPSLHSETGIQVVHDQGTGDQTPQVAQDNKITDTHIYESKPIVPQPTRSKRPTKHQLQQFLLETRKRRQEEHRRGRQRSQHEIIQSKMHNARTLAENNQETLLEYIDEITSHDTN